jgi:DNA invertase Pin-like site-specific DNA recombinase
MNKRPHHRAGTTNRKKPPSSPSVAIAYLRVSTDEQALGLAAQRAAIEAWASANAVTVAEWCTDEGVSGGASIEQRPGLENALAFIKKRGAGLLVVARRDRLARDSLIAAMIESLAKNCGASIASVAGEGTDATGEDPSAQLLRRIVDAFSEYERAVIRLRTRKALAVKRERGEITGGTPPWGYRLADDGTTRTWVPHEREQRMVTIACALRAQRKTFATIAAELTAAGFTTRSGAPLSIPLVHRLVATIAPRERNPEKAA